MSNFSGNDLNIKIYKILRCEFFRRKSTLKKELNNKE